MGRKYKGNKRFKQLDKTKRLEEGAAGESAANSSRNGDADSGHAGEGAAAPSSPGSDKPTSAERETSPPLSDHSASTADPSPASSNKPAKMAAPTNTSRVFDIDKEDPDSWCTVGLLTNTECHQLILADETGIKSFGDLPADEQHSITAHLGTDAVQTVCFHHQKFYLCMERHKQGCLDRFYLHESKSEPTGLVKVTSLLAESCRDVVNLEEGERLCQLCIDEIKKKQDASGDGPSRRNSFAFVFSSKKYQDRAKRIDDIVTRCSVGLMTRSLCHMTLDSFEESVRAFSALPRSTAKTLVSRLGRAFDNICVHHERLYLEGYGAPCFDPENKHSNQGSSTQKWLVPRRFSLVCRGKYPIKPGRTVCVKCLKSLCNKYPEIKAFYKEDERAIEEKLATTAEGAEGEAKAEQDTPQGSDTENGATKDDDDEWKYDRLGRRKRRSTITTTERQLRNLRVDNPEFSEILGSGHREKRKVTKRIKNFTETYKGRTSRHYNAKGIHISSNKDACDCLQADCPGCHFPCAKCGSTKCGVECRCNRNWVYEQLEIDGVPDTVYQNPLLN